MASNSSSSSQLTQNDAIRASGQLGEHTMAPSNPSVPASAPPKCITPKPQSPLDPVCTHDTAHRMTSDSCTCQPARPTLDTRLLPAPRSEATSPWLPSPNMLGRSRASSNRAAPIGRLDESTMTVEVELSSEAAKKAENSLWWRIRK